MIGCPAAYDAATARPTQPSPVGSPTPATNESPKQRMRRSWVMRDRAYGGPRADERRRAQFRSLA